MDPPPSLCLHTRTHSHAIFAFQRQGLKTVQSLNLSWNRIDDDGCLPIARLLGPLSQLAINKSVREKAAAALVKVRVLHAFLTSPPRPFLRLMLP